MALHKKSMIIEREHWRIKGNFVLYSWCSKHDVKTINFKRIILKDFYELCHNEEFRKSKYVLKLENESVEDIKPLSWIYNHRHLYISERIDITQKPSKYNWLKHIWSKLRCYIRGVKF